MKDWLWATLCDRLILRPTRHPIQAAGKQHVLSHGEGRLEVWIHRRGPDTTARANLYVLAFPGTASRAESLSSFLDDGWPEAHVEIWSVNPPGYGGSSGRASLRQIPATADRALDEVRRVAGGHPIIVTGGSLGCVGALYLAARRDVSGLLLENPPDLRQVILTRGQSWPARLAARHVAAQVPAELDSLRNAEQASAPAVFMLAMNDRVVPTEVQQRVYGAYVGPKRLIERPGADHDTPFSEGDLQQLQGLKAWLHDVVCEER